MLGRTAGVVALRDGLYSACEAYADRIIGKDAYALILSQYGNLLVALAGGSNAGSSGSGGASAGNNVPVMQQVALQALLVACISDGDPTLHADSASRNRFLMKYCDPILSGIVSAIPGLLRSAANANTKN